jgi:hypothetical protein
MTERRMWNGGGSFSWVENVASNGAEKKVGRQTNESIIL